MTLCGRRLRSVGTDRIVIQSITAEHVRGTAEFASGTLAHGGLVRFAELPRAPHVHEFKNPQLCVCNTCVISPILAIYAILASNKINKLRGINTVRRQKYT